MISARWLAGALCEQPKIDLDRVQFRTMSSSGRIFGGLSYFKTINFELYLHAHNKEVLKADHSQVNDEWLLEHWLDII